MELSAREKKLLIVLAVIVAGLALFYIIINPLMDFKKSLNDSGAGAQARISELESIYTQYKSIREKRENYDQLIKDGS
ncbi:MAG: hypothetical protein LBT84_06095, partial [Spirochaetia bacterium]|nr:hypothetical protein [Spirochaetia bacterium]